MHSLRRALCIGISLVLMFSVWSYSPVTTTRREMKGGDLVNISLGELEMGLAYEIHAPMYIDGDVNLSDTAQLELWEGDGGENNPFIIEGYSIDLGGAPGNCITIYNTSLHVIVRDCFLTGATAAFMAGIRLENVTNSILDGNTFFDNSYGIYLYNSHHNIVRNNNYTMNLRGVVLEYDSVLNEFYNNTFSWNWVYGISLQSSGGNDFLNNTFLHNDVGVRVGDGCSANDFRKNFFIMNHFDALLFSGTGRNNLVFWNTFHLNMISVTDHSVDGNHFGYNYYSEYSDLDQQGDGIYDGPYVHFRLCWKHRLQSTGVHSDAASLGTDTNRPDCGTWRIGVLWTQCTLFTTYQDLAHQ